LLFVERIRVSNRFVESYRTTYLACGNQKGEGQSADQSIDNAKDIIDGAKHRFLTLGNENDKNPAS
jgi:hypothetical protein